MKDANQIAQETARREGTSSFRQEIIDQRAKGPVRGTLTIWQDIHRMLNGDPWLLQSQDVVLDLTRPGLLITYEANGDAEVFVPVPGWYLNFVPDRAGE